MACLKPFKAIRPAQNFQEIIPALPYDVYNRAEAKDFVNKNPHSFLSIDRPETQFDDSFDMYSQSAYDKARDLLQKWLTEGSFIQEKDDCYYIYELTMNGRTQTGLVGCASIDQYLDGTIKKHENTLEAKEQDRINHVYTCKAQTGPIFLSCKNNEDLSTIFIEIKNKSSVYDFTFEDGVRHRVWIVQEKDLINRIKNICSDIDCLYIADGHHRCASAVKVGQKFREENPNYSGNEEFNYFLSVVFPADELKIYDYNRVVKDLNGLDDNQFLDAIKTVFDVGESSSYQIKPSKKFQVSMYLEGMWYLLEFKSEYLTDDPVAGLDVALLQTNVLDKILGIKDPKTDSRIKFIGGIKGLNELENFVNKDFAVAFAMYPTSIDELFKVADQNLLMPPKSTWFEPKLRSGIFIHSIN